MKYRNGVVCIVLISCLLVLIQAPNSLGKPNASMKFSSIREENPRAGGEETLILPYIFPSDSMGTTVGVGGLRKGFFQDQLLLAGTIFGSADSAYGTLLGMWDLAVLPSSDRFYFSAIGSVGHYPRQKAYAGVNPVHGTKAGSNDSDEDDYIEKEGDDNWWISLIGGILTAMFGYFIMSNLFAGAVAITIWLGLGLLIFGIINVVVSLKMRKVKVKIEDAIS